jgi:hypothetical protein
MKIKRFQIEFSVKSQMRARDITITQNLKHLLICINYITLPTCKDIEGRDKILGSSTV